MSDGLGRRRFLKSVGAGAAVAAGCDDTSETELEANATTFEYIVIGSGAGGGPLAANLARAGHRVLLLEAGEDRGEEEVYQVPAFHPQSTEDATMRWDYFVKHYDDDAQAATNTKLTDRGVLYPRAGTLGGCTAHNALITVYPHESDWNHIADVTGDDSWRAENMRRYFQDLEHCDYLGKNDDRTGHGFDGWLHTRQPDARIALQDKKLLKVVKGAALEFDLQQSGGFLDTLNELFFQNELFALMKRDLNSGAPGRDQVEGLFTIPMHANGVKRNGPREYILATVDEGFPLTVRTGAYATKITFSAEEGPDGELVASGVEYLEGKHLYRADPSADSGPAGKKRKATAKAEVIVSCGVFNTPQLLKLSGIGPRAELDELGITVLLDLPGVGENLQDRYEVGLVSEVDSDFNVLKGCTLGAPGDPCLDDWRRGKGVYTSNGGTVGIVFRSSPSEPDPDLFVFGLPGDFRGYFPGYSDRILDDHRHFTWAILKAHTKNTAGVVKLASTDPLDTPDIRFRYFHEGTTAGGEDAQDLAAMVSGVDLARRIGQRIDDLMLFNSFQEVWPGPSVQTQAEVESFVKAEAWGHHASCTCKIGADDDPMAVLDSKFRVRGTKNLRVVDASVFPKIPGFFIVVPIYMVAEKATGDILAARPA